MSSIIEYTLEELEDMADPEPSCHLIPHWLDRDAAPDVELAALYHRRGSIEQSLDEFKVHLAARDVVLRSKRPELVEQEFHALLPAHAAIRRLMTQAAAAAGQAAEDWSFIQAVRVLRRRLPASAAIPP